MRQLVFLMLIFCASTLAKADDKILIAVASNFERTLTFLRQDFAELEPNTDIVISAAASGAHFQQIRHGAPCDIFLSADAIYPAKLNSQKPMLNYAYGKLALASRLPIELSTLGSVKLAIANPNIAPYGRAAIEFLNAQGIQHDGPMGNNVGQTLAYLTSGGVDAALVALSQRDLAPQFIWQTIPEHQYQAIRQVGILLTDTPSSHRFWDYLQSPRAKDIISANGYGVE